MEKSVEEINQQLDWGKTFSENRPMSRFGDNNAKRYSIHKTILDMAKSGIAMFRIERHIQDMFGEDQATAYEVYDWLKGNTDPMYCEEDTKP